jgi:hypothetical protein
VKERRRKRYFCRREGAPLKEVTLYFEKGALAHCERRRLNMLRRLAG